MPLPDKLLELITVYGNACFKSGKWAGGAGGITDSAHVGYEVLVAEPKAAKAELIAAIERLKGDAE